MKPTSARKSNALLALTASALAIPGMVRRASAQTSEATQLDYRYSAYREGDISASKTGGKASERYSVDSHQFRAATVLRGTTELSADVAVETMSGASPWFITPGADGRPVQVMSGATIRDLREGFELRAKQHFGDLAAGLQTGYSNERDYRSANGGVEASWSFDQQLNTVTGGIGYTDNTLEPFEGRSTRFPDRIAHANSREVVGFLGYSRLLGRDTQVQTSISYTRLAGFLSDPYKRAYAGGNLLPDSRPNQRRDIAWAARFRQYVPPLDAALHLDYRYFWNDWSIKAHTVSLAWYQTMPGDWQLVPGVRWYSQSQAFFYAPFYDSARADDLSSSDYRLSPYGAISFSVDANKELWSWKLSLRYENYRSGSGLALRSVAVENPGLVDFQVFSVALAKTF